MWCVFQNFLLLLIWHFLISKIFYMLHKIAFWINNKTTLIRYPQNGIPLWHSCVGVFFFFFNLNYKFVLVFVLHRPSCQSFEKVTVQEQSLGKLEALCTSHPCSLLWKDLWARHPRTGGRKWTRTKCLNFSTQCSAHWLQQCAMSQPTHTSSKQRFSMRSWQMPFDFLAASQT